VTRLEIAGSGPRLEQQSQRRCAILVLSRKTSERILIGDEIAITIVRIGPNSVRIGIEAPKTMSIVREELKKELVDALKHDCD
jgi:carbon storage regulator